MSKFCGNCGTELDDNAKICGNCGTPLENKDAKVPGVDYSDPEKQKKVKKVVKGAAILAVVIIIAIIAINIISNSTGYNGVARKVMKAYKKYDIDSIVSVSSELYSYTGEDYAESYFERIISNDFDIFEKEVGHNYKLDYKVTDTYKMSKHKYESLLDSLSLYGDFDADIISKVMLVEVTVTAKDKSDKMTKKLELTLTKESGSWKILYIN